jgi:hypothetical protein
MFEYNSEIFTGQPFDVPDGEMVDVYYEPSTEAGWVDGDLLCSDYAVTSDAPDIARDASIASRELQRRDIAGEIVPVDQEIFALTQHAVAVAEAIAEGERFNHAGAEMSMRLVSALFNDTDALDGAALAKLGTAEAAQLHDLALATYAVLGSRLREKVAFRLAADYPRTQADTTAVMMGAAYNAMQSAMRAGPNSRRGYGQEQEEAIRELVVQYAHTFAAIYSNLSAVGHPKAVDPGHRQYFQSTILAATALSVHPTAEAPAAANEYR